MAEYFKFDFDFIFTVSDLEMFRTQCAETSLGYRWEYVSDTKLVITRAAIRYVLQLNHGTGTHEALYFIDDRYEDIEECIKVLSPRKTLIKLLSKWTRHTPSLIE